MSPFALTSLVEYKGNIPKYHRNSITSSFSGQNKGIDVKTSARKKKTSPLQNISLCGQQSRWGISSASTTSATSEMSKTQQLFNGNSILGSPCHNIQPLHSQHHLRHQMNQENLTTSLIFTAANLNSIDLMSIERHLEGS